MKFWNHIGLPVLLLAAFAGSRLPGMMPAGLENFSPVYALLFCAGVYLPRRLAWWLPLLTLLATDLVLNQHYQRQFAADPGAYVVPVHFFSPFLLVNYAAYAVLVWLGTRFRPTAQWLRLVGGGLAGALIFYLLSNTASWFQLPGYEKSLRGWFQALTTGLPGFPPTWVFGLKTLLSGGLFTGLFVGAMHVAGRESEAREPEAEEDNVEEEGGGPEEAPA